VPAAFFTSQCVDGLSPAGKRRGFCPLGNLPVWDE
jgi:hypothetical protein